MARLVRTVRGMLAVGAVLAFAGAVAEAAVVTLRSEARVAGPVVRLADVAEIVDADVVVINRLAEKTLAPAPAADQTVRLDFAAIRSRLQAQGVDLSQVEFAGSSTVTVRSTIAQSGSQDDGPADWQRQRAESLVQQAIATHLERVAPELGPVTIAADVSSRDIPTILESATAGYAVAGGAAPWQGPQAFVIRCRDERGVTSDLRMAARVEPLPQVLALRHVVPAGYVLQATDLVWQPADETAGAVMRLEEAVGRETRRTIRVGEVLRADDIRVVPLVRANDIVTVYSRMPGIRVKRQFKARSEGALGDPVKLVTLDGRQTVIGRVTGYHEAEVDGAGANVAEPNPRLQFVPGPTGPAPVVR